MKPEQFIREYGVKKAREVVAASANALVQCSDGTTFHVNDLKNLIGSLNLIEAVGGIQEAISFSGSSLYFTADRECMYRAIRDHESIYGGGDEAN